jgi:carboxylesterase type B
MSIGVLYPNSNLQNLVRAVVRRTFHLSPALTFEQIFESGSAGGPHVFDAFRGQTDWDNFVRAVPECANCKEDSIACLQRVNSSAALLEAIETSWAESNEGYPFVPVIDGPHGLLPDLPSVLMAKGEFARVPFISGANLDEGAVPRV